MRSNPEIYILLVVDCALKEDKDGIRLGTIYEIQPLLTSEISRQQFIGVDENRRVYRTCLSSMGFDPDKILSESIMQPVFAYDKNELRKFMHSGSLACYAPRFVSLEQASSKEEAAQQTFKENLRAFYDGCIADKSTHIVIKKAQGTRGLLNFFMSFIKENSFEDFYCSLLCKINEIKKTKYTVKSGILTRIITLQNKDLLVEQCRNESFDAASGTAKTYRLIFAIKSQDGVMDTAFRVSQMQLHNQFNSHGSNRGVCFFDGKEWAYLKDDCVEMVPLSDEFAKLEESINNDVMLKANMRRIAFAITSECEKQEIKPKRVDSTKPRVSGIWLPPISDDSFSVLRKPDHSFFYCSPIELIECTKNFVETVISRDHAVIFKLEEQLNKLESELEDELKKDNSETAQNYVSSLSSYPVIMANWIAKFVHNDKFVQRFITSLNNPDFWEIKKTFLILLLGTNNTEEVIKDRIILDNGLKPDDLHYITSTFKERSECTMNNELSCRL